MAEMYVQGVSTRKVDEVFSTLCGLRVSSSQVSRATAEPEPQFNSWRNRPLGAQPYLVLDARFEKVRIDGSLRDCEVLVALGIAEDGRRSILGVSCALIEAEVHWRGFLESLQQRGLHGVRLIVSDNHQGLRSAIKARFGSIPHRRCQFHLIQNAMDHVPKLALRPQVLEQLRTILRAPNKPTAQNLLREMVDTYSKSALELAVWLEANVPESFTVFDLPQQHWVKMRTGKMIERVNQELKPRTRVIRVFPNIASLLRLITARPCEISDSWESGKVYLNMNPESQFLAA
jgi:putative transposase